MALLSVLAQLVGLATAVYLMFAKSFLTGLALAAFVVIGHFVMSRLANGLMLVHQKLLMSKSELQVMALYAQAGRSDAAPRAWGWIATACGAVYIGGCAAAIWYFVVS